MQRRVIRFHSNSKTKRNILFFCVQLPNQEHTQHHHPRQQQVTQLLSIVQLRFSSVGDVTDAVRVNKVLPKGRECSLHLEQTNNRGRLPKVDDIKRKEINVSKVGSKGSIVLDLSIVNINTKKTISKNISYPAQRKISKQRSHLQIVDNDFLHRFRDSSASGFFNCI